MLVAWPPTSQDRRNFGGEGSRRVGGMRPTYSSWQQSVAGTVSSAAAQVDLPGRRFRCQLDDSWLRFVPDDALEPGEQISVAADVGCGFLEKGLLVDQILRPDVAQLEELRHVLTVADELLDTIKEEGLIGTAQSAGNRGNRLRESRDEAWRHRWGFSRRNFWMALFVALSIQVSLLAPHSLRVDGQSCESCQRGATETSI